MDRERLDELASLRDLGQTDAMSDAQLVELGRYLGAAVIVTGRVADVGTDFLLTLRAVETGLSMPLPAPHAFLPMGERGTLLKKAFVVKTKAGAIYRAFLPGWGNSTTARNTTGKAE